jgi:hypothetical protein
MVAFVNRILMNQAVHTQWTFNCGFSPAVVYTFLLLCVLQKTKQLAILVHEAVNYLFLLIVALKSCLFNSCEWVLSVPSVGFLHQTSFIPISKAYMLLLSVSSIMHKRK